MKETKEYRVVENAELRSDAKSNRVIGYAAPFDEPSLPLGPTGYTERIRRGAFASSIKGDVVALFNHDPGHILGRTPSTMTLSEDTQGLKTEISLPDTSLGRDIHALVKRQDLRGMSIGFSVTRDAWNDAHTERTLLQVDLHEVSIVAWPAYPQTTVQARSLGLPADVTILTYRGLWPAPDDTLDLEEQRERLRLRLELLRRL